MSSQYKFWRKNTIIVFYRMVCGACLCAGERAVFWC